MDTNDEPVRRRGLLARPVIAAAAIAGVAAAFALGMGVGGRGPGPIRPGPGQAPVAFKSGLRSAHSCDDLLQTYVARAQRVVGPWGWPGQGLLGGRAEDGVAPLAGQAPALGRAPSAAAGTTSEKTAVTQGQQSSATGTNVQEIGVDEPDTVKTGGHVLAKVHDDELWIYDVSGSVVRRLSSTPLDGMDDAELLLSGRTLVALGADSGDTSVPSTRVLTIDISDPRAPKQTDDVVYSAPLLSARQHGHAIRLVLDSPLPDLDFAHPGRNRSAAVARRHNRELVAHTAIDDWLPSYTTGGKTHRLLDCGDVAIPSDKVGPGTVSVVGFDISGPTDLDTVGLAGATEIAYESRDHLYLAAPPSYDVVSPLVGCIGCMRSGPDVASISGGTSYVYDFALDGTAARHVASGEVEGRIDDRWAMDEHGGVLRVAVSPTQDTGDFSSIVTLRPLGADLEPLGRIDRIGVGEEIKSVRWFDDLAIVVTFREVDPMFAIDLSHPAHPRRLGELRMPGYSSYLHPLGPHRLIGVGVGPDGSTQIGVFGTDDLRHLKRFDTVRVRDSEPLAGQDPRTFTWDAQSRTAYAVVQRWRSTRIGYVATAVLRHARLHTHLTQVEYGDDVDRVRTVPLDDGRVVLVTGEDARFLPRP